ncbi:MAG: hypothetical protein JWO67_3185 [Streptosporangiaceae bacterium]|nr:hypothetical protein [Streptosporangiaceae bacterium]
MARFGRSFPTRPKFITGLTRLAVGRSVTDSALASDSVTRTLTLATRAVSDSALASDTVTKSTPRSLSDSALASDTVSRGALALTRAVSDSAVASDTIARTISLAVRVVFDSAQAVDTLGERVLHVITPSSNWPLLGMEVDFQYGPPYIPGFGRQSINSAYRRLSVRRWSVRRGRQYELDQVQAGEATLEIPDPGEVLNPDNPSSPFNQNGNQVTPYRAMRIWGMWPNQPGSGNIFATTVTQGMGLPDPIDPEFEHGTGLIDGGWDGTAVVAWSTEQAWNGTHSAKIIQQAAPEGAGGGTGSASGFNKGVYIQSAVTTAPRVTYTASCYVYPTGGCSVQIAVYDATGYVTYSATATAQNTWTRIQVSWTTVDTLEYINIFGSGSATPTFYVDGAQLEFGGVVNPFTASGPTLYPIYTGYVERWPTKYDMSGLRANRPLVAVDALAILSRTVIDQSYHQAVMLDGPSAYAAYDEQSGPNLFTSPDGMKLLGSQNPAPQGGQINFAGDTFLDGSAAVSLSQQIQDPAQTAYAKQVTSIDIPHTNSFSVNTGSATFEFWARWVAGNATLGMFQANSSGEFVDFSASTSDHTRDTAFGVSLVFGGLYIGSSDGRPGTANGNIYGAPATKTFALDGSANLPDGQWHYYSIGLFPGGGNYSNQYVMRLVVDDRVYSFEVPATVGASSIRHLGFNAITNAVSSRWGDQVSAASVAKAAFYPTYIGSDRQVAHYQRGAGYVGEYSGARVKRLLEQYWKGGGATVADGYMAMTADHDYSTRVVLDVLQEIEESERGLTYASAAGWVVFEDRLSRYYTNNDTAKWVFGENPAGANPTEYPYEDYAADHDPTYTFSQANLSRQGNSNFAPMINAATQAKYGQRIVSQEIKTLTDFDLTQAGIFYLGRYGTPKTRVSTLKLNPTVNPSLWPAILSLEVSQRVTVTRRSSSGLVLTSDYYVEQINHQVDGETSSWSTTLQLSPVFVTTSWVCGSSTRGVLGTSTVPVY